MEPDLADLMMQIDAGWASASAPAPDAGDLWGHLVGVGPDGAFTTLPLTAHPAAIVANLEVPRHWQALAVATFGTALVAGRESHARVGWLCHRWAGSASILAVAGGEPTVTVTSPDLAERLDLASGTVPALLRRAIGCPSAT